MSSIEERVAAGARWLDLHRPGWADRIDLDELDLSDPCACVLGQEYGSYAEAPEELWVEDDTCAKSGFNATRVRDYERIEVEFSALTDAWRRLIEQRRAVSV
jgi:hypothetical protein